MNRITMDLNDQRVRHVWRTLFICPADPVKVPLQALTADRGMTVPAKIPTFAAISLHVD